MLIDEAIVMYQPMLGIFACRGADTRVTESISAEWTW